jgi:aminomethyltransferase
MLKRTALYEEHLKLKGRMVPFGGWELPVQYSGVMAEHQAVRTACGLFDVSHMGEIEIEGPGALAFLSRVTINDPSTLALWQAQYSAFCNESGGIIDDLVIYRTGEQRYFLVVNASNTDKDFDHLSRLHREWTGDPISLKNRSADYSQIALQGPRSAEVLARVCPLALDSIQNYWCAEGTVAGARALVARTGYTGEDGFEIYLSPADAPTAWRALLDSGAGAGILPCGLGARDTLRLEMKYALYGHELDDSTGPLETGLGWITKLKKPVDFVGRSAIEAMKAAGPARALVGLRSEGRGIARQGAEVYDADRITRIGTVTSGTQSPTLKQSIAIALIQKSHESIGTKIWVKVREEFLEYVVSPTPFISKSRRNV